MALTYAQRILKEADAFDGKSEPSGRNDGAWLVPLQEEAAAALGYAKSTYYGAPYCAIGVGHCVRTSGMPHDPQLVHPATSFMCAEARKEGVLFDAPGKVPPGSFMIKCWVHTGIVVQDMGSTFRAFEFNHDNRCGYTWRTKSDWDFIVPEPLKDEPTPSVVMVDRYGFDDLLYKPQLIGPWLTIAGRDKKLAEWQAGMPGWWTRKVKVNRPSPYGFETGAPGTYGQRWEFGPWADKDTRDAKAENYAKNTGHPVRTWRRQVPLHLDASGNPIAADSGTNL